MANPAQPNFNIGDMVGQSWKIVQNNAGILIGGAALLIIIQSVISTILQKILGAGGLAQLILGGPFLLGYFGVTLKAVRGGKPAFEDLFSGFQRFLPAFVANLVISILTGIGFILCILPGIFVAMIYSLTYLYMHDRRLDFWPAMESSRQTVMAALGAWVPLYLVFILLCIVGALACGVGIIVTAPIAVVLLTLAYEQVSGGATILPDEPVDYQ